MSASPPRDAATTVTDVVDLGVSDVPDAAVLAPIPGYGAAPKPWVFPEPGDTLLHFHLLTVLGSGAFSRVFLASQQDLAGRLVALKVSERSDAEPQRLARLQHTNIVPIYSVHQHFQFQVVCMPYLGAHTLATLLRHRRDRMPDLGREVVETLQSNSAQAAPTKPDNGQSPSPEPPLSRLLPDLELLARCGHARAVLWLAARIADGLAHAHGRGILHCDLKPENILLADDGQPMLLDFNVARDGRPGAANDPHLGGTVRYMAPEHLQSVLFRRDSIDARADLYSLGLIIYQLLTGRDPHDVSRLQGVESVPAVLAARQCLPEPPSRRDRRLTPAVDAIVLKLLAPDPADRYQSAVELREDLERHLADRPLRYAANTSLMERVGKWRRRNPRLATGLAVAVAVLGLVVLPTAAIVAQRERAVHHRLEQQRADAEHRCQSELERLRTAQLLLATRSGERTLLDRGFSMGHEVLSTYGVGQAGWTNRPEFAHLTESRQNELRQELVELLLLMTHCEQMKGDPASALHWNKLAEECCVGIPRPTWLGRQRAALLTKLPGAAPELPRGSAVEVDSYHDALELAMRGQPTEALQQLVDLTNYRPSHFMSWYVRGACHSQLKQLAEAAAAFSVCASLRPQSPWPYFSRGLVRLEQGRFREAENDFTWAISYQPEPQSTLVRWSLMNRAIAREGRRDFRGANEDLSAVLTWPDAPTRAYFLRSRVRRAMGKTADADRDAAEGFKRTPTDAISWSTRGTWRMARDPNGALADFDAALKVDPQSASALRNKAVVLADYLNRPGEAVAVLDRMLELYPSDIDARAGRGVYLARLGNDERARKDATDTLRDEPSAFRFYQIAGLYAQLAKHKPEGPARDEALRLLARAFRNGFADFKLLERDSDLDPIRDSAEFRTLVAHARGLQRP